MSSLNNRYLKDSTVFRRLQMALVHLLIRLRDEQRKKQLVKEQQPQEAKAQQTKGKSEEDLHRLKQDDNEQKTEQQAQMDREVGDHHRLPGRFSCINTLCAVRMTFFLEFKKEKAKFQAQEDAERQRQDRELQTQQEEEERQLRKKVSLKRKTDMTYITALLSLHSEFSQVHWGVLCFCRELRRS